MKIAGIIAEYNPFHNGHAHHIERTKAKGAGCEATHIVAVMSGNYMQRGEPALLPKRYRAAMALSGGADLVIELPLPWALGSAEQFAEGAVSLLDSLGCVETVSFGSECGNIEALAAVAEKMDSPRFESLLRYHMESGISYPKARQQALREIAGAAADLLDSPNNTLGIEYLRAIKRQGSSMEGFTVLRHGASHESLAPVGTVASAAYIRSLCAEGRTVNAAPYLPATSLKLLSAALEEGHAPSKTALVERALLFRLRSMTKEETAALPGVSEGLENRLYAAAREATGLEDLLETVKTKRYPRTRLQRLVWAAYTGLTAQPSGALPPYIRVLAMNEKGKEILAAARAARTYLTREMPLILRAADANNLTGYAANVWQQECVADDRYALTLPTPLPCGTDYTDGLIK